jgi:hypothetical protein
MRHAFLIARVLILALVVASFVAKTKGMQPFGFSTGA